MTATAEGIEQRQAGPYVVEVPRGQFRVLCELLKDGESSRIIGKRLFISEQTVKTHLRRLYAATGYHSRTALITAIVQRRLKVVQVVPGDRRFRSR